MRDDIDAQPDAGNGHDHPHIHHLETKVWKKDGQPRLFVSADDTVKLLEEVAANLEQAGANTDHVRAQLSIINDLTGALLTAIATANTE
jgi:ABC-type Zn2+ transport system substrate-binding protein/surface adhesin